MYVLRNFSVSSMFLKRMSDYQWPHNFHHIPYCYYCHHYFHTANTKLYHYYPVIFYLYMHIIILCYYNNIYYYNNIFLLVNNFILYILFFCIFLFLSISFFCFAETSYKYNKLKMQRIWSFFCETIHGGKCARRSGSPNWGYLPTFYL